MKLEPLALLALSSSYRSLAFRGVALRSIGTPSRRTPVALLAMPKSKVVVVGSINQDLTVYAPSLPGTGETVLGTDFATSPGGKGANQAVAAARCLRTSRVHMVGRVGDDAMGAELVEKLRGDGVGVEAEESMAGEAHTGVASISVDENGGNTSECQCHRLWRVTLAHCSNSSLQ